MINSQLTTYIQEQLNLGMTRQQITAALLANGWTEALVNEAFASLSGVPTPTPPVATPVVAQQEVRAAAEGVLPGAFATLAQAWSIYREKFGVLVSIALVPVVAGLAALPLTLSLLKDAQWIPLALMMVVLSLLSAWSTAALIYATQAVERISVGSAYGWGGRNFLSYAWIGLLVLFISTGAFVLLIVPGVLFLIWFSFALFVFAAEGERGMNALLKSREYVRGSWWGTFWRLLCIGALAIVVSLLVNLFGIFGFWVEMVAGFVANLLLGPLTVAYFFSLYTNLKAHRGPFTFVPTRGRKVAFASVGVLGLLGPILISFVLAWLLVLAGSKPAGVALQTSETTAGESAAQTSQSLASVGYAIGNNDCAHLYSNETPKPLPLLRVRDNPEAPDVVVEDIRPIFEGAGIETYRRSFHPISSSGAQVFFVSMICASDSGGLLLVSYDLSAGVAKKMRINTVFKIASLDDLSPDRTKMVTVSGELEELKSWSGGFGSGSASEPEEQVLWLLDFVSDTATQLHVLPQGQSFFAECEQALMGQCKQMPSWADDETIEYSVYTGSLWESDPVTKKGGPYQIPVE